jgi:two-component system, NarL family, response regulator DegU
VSIKLIIADDHTLLRQGIRNVLELESDLEIIAEACDGEDAIRKIDSHRPDVVLLDLNMPKRNGIEVARWVKKTHPEIQIVILTIHEDENYMFEVIRAGALGYLLKEVEPKMLVKAIHLVAAGQSFIYPTLTGRLVGEFTRLADAANEYHQRYLRPHPDQLTVREMDILQLLVGGLSNQEIATRLYLSEKTIKNHLTSVFRKFGVNDRTQAALYALKHKLIDEVREKSREKPKEKTREPGTALYV